MPLEHGAERLHTASSRHCSAHRWRSQGVHRRLTDTYGVLTGYSRGTHGLLTGYSWGNQEYSQGWRSRHSGAAPSSRPPHGTSRTSVRALAHACRRARPPALTPAGAYRYETKNACTHARCARREQARCALDTHARARTHPRASTHTTARAPTHPLGALRHRHGRKHTQTQAQAQARTRPRPHANTHTPARSRARPVRTGRHRLQAHAARGGGGRQRPARRPLALRVHVSDVPHERARCSGHWSARLGVSLTGLCASSPPPEAPRPKSEARSNLRDGGTRLQGGSRRRDGVLHSVAYNLLMILVPTADSSAAVVRTVLEAAP